MRVCLVAAGGDRLSDEGTVGRARERAESGARVRALVCASRRQGQALARALWQCGVTVEWLEDAKCPIEVTVREAESAAADASDRVRHALEAMHRREGLDEVEFPALGGIGFRAIQAQRCGVGLEGVSLVVRLDSCSSWERHCRREWPDGAEALRVEHLERYAFENATRRVFARADVAALVERSGWATTGPERQRGGAKAPSLALGDSCALVTVCVPHYNLGAHLPAALESLAQQTYQQIEVLVIDDGSTDAGSLRVFDAMRQRYPTFRFLRQPNAGIGATRNRGLAEARGEYFLPMDADNVAHPEMIARFVAALEQRPDVAALTCYFLAFHRDDDIPAGRFAFAGRPTGGPHLLAALRNVYGDANALFRTEALRAVGGYETDRDTSYEDWELFVKLSQMGHAIDVLPEALFYYRHLPEGFSRRTDRYANQMRVLRQFGVMENLPPAERALLWQVLVGTQLRVEHQEARLRSRRHRLAEGLYALGLRGLRALTRTKGGEPC